MKCISWSSLRAQALRKQYTGISKNSDKSKSLELDGLLHLCDNCDLSRECLD